MVLIWKQQGITDSATNASQQTYLFLRMQLEPQLEAKLTRKTERPIKSIYCKHKEHAWKMIEFQSLELGKSHQDLYGQIKGKVEAKFHPKCRMAFNTEYHNHVRAKKGLRSTNWTLINPVVLKHIIKPSPQLLTISMHMFLSRMKCCGSLHLSSCILKDLNDLTFQTLTTGERNSRTIAKP